MNRRFLSRKRRLKMLVSIKTEISEDGSIRETMQTVHPLSEKFIEDEFLLQRYIESTGFVDKITCRDDEELNQAYKIFKRLEDHGGLWNPCKFWTTETVEALWQLYEKDNK